jgi:hypothetical protein
MRHAPPPRLQRDLRKKAARGRALRNEWFQGAREMNCELWWRALISRSNRRRVRTALPRRQKLFAS